MGRLKIYRVSIRSMVDARLVPRYVEAADLEKAVEIFLDWWNGTQRIHGTKEMKMADIVGAELISETAIVREVEPS